MWKLSRNLKIPVWHRWNLKTLQEFVDSYGHMLGGGHISIVLLSRDSAGNLHVAAARIAATGGEMEILIR